MIVNIAIAFVIIMGIVSFFAAPYLVNKDGV